MTNIHLEAITFDCADAGALAAFWSTLLDHPVDDGASESYAAIGLSDDNKLRPAFAFIQVPEGKTAKNRCHPDLVTDDLEAAVAKAVAAGATHVADVEEDGNRWTTLTDPEGNELDLVAG
jgi:predicted enzyme related to lactoylglutathione lyase